VSSTSTTTTVPSTSTTSAPSTTTTTQPSTTTTTTPAAQPVTGGYDISWPQCSTSYPSNPAFGIVGVSDGRPFHDNPCLADEYAWAVTAPSAAGFYMNTANPGASSVHWTEAGPRACSGASDDLGCAYNYGWNAAAHAFAYADAQTGGAATATWWLDIETANTWSSSTSVNTADIRGMVDYFAAASLPVGIYSTTLDWDQITGGLALDVPNWVAGASGSTQAVRWCSSTTSTFTGGRVALVQYPLHGFDGNAAC